MRIDIMTLFPESVGDMLCESILGRAEERGYIRIECHQIRDYTLNKQKQVDDYPYGGGRGAVMQAIPCTNAGSISATKPASGSIPSIFPPAAKLSVRPQPSAWPQTMTVWCWYAVTTRVSMSGLLRNAWTKKFPWATLC